MGDVSMVRKVYQARPCYRPPVPELPDVVVYMEALEARVRGEAALREHDPGGLDVLAADAASFRRALECRNHTLKRALTDPGILSGIGNAYSDEILHRARLSPVRQTRQLTDAERIRLFAATRDTLLHWCERLRREAGPGFPEGVTAFREGMAVHGRYGQACPQCGAPAQRIVC